MDFYSITKVIADLPELSAALDYDGLLTYIPNIRCTGSRVHVLWSIVQLSIATGPWTGTCTELPVHQMFSAWWLTRFLISHSSLI